MVLFRFVFFFVHDSDVMERMIKAGCAATSDFEWLSQLRFVFSRDDGPFGMCSVRQTNCQLEFSYEYQVRYDYQPPRASEEVELY